MSGEFVGRKGVSLERLQSLCLVAEAGSIMAAAKGDPNRQSLFSRQIKELETALGLELLERTSVPYRLSRDGERVEGLARALITGVDRILDEANQRPSEVCIGAGESILQWLVLPLLGPALDRRAIRIRCQNLRSREIVDALRQRRAHIGILSSRHLQADLRSKSLGSYGAIVVGNPAVLPKSEELEWKDLQHLPLATLEGGSALRYQVDRLLQESKQRPNLRLECTSYPQVIEVCANAGMIGLLPGVAKRSALQAGLRVSRVKELQDLSFELVVMWHPAVASAQSEVREVLTILAGERVAG